MSKPVKNLITDVYRKKFANLDGAVLVDIRGLTSNDNNNLRAGLLSKKVRVTVVKNSLALKAFKGTNLENLNSLIEGPSAMVYSAESVVTVAREVIEAIKTLETVKVKGAIMDGQVFSADQVKALAKYPTKIEAQGQVVTLLLSPAKKIAGQLVAPGRKLASLIKAIEERKEKTGDAPIAALA
ncbi:MAG: 50S ribosomal protein L10 [Planctomycetes bacterium]|nr:50S ribosomal protein L10 [Planctomycetota bacterium]